MSNNSSGETQQLEDRLTAANIQAENYLETAQELHDDAETIAIDYQQQLPIHDDQWSEDDVDSYLDRLERIIKDPQVTQSKDRLKEIEIPEEQVNTIRDEQLEDFESVDKLAEEYEELEDRYGDTIHFLIDDELLVNWIRDSGPSDSKEKLDLDTAKYDALVDLDNLPEELVEEYFQGAMLDEKSIGDAQELDGWIGTISSHSVEVNYDGNLSSFRRTCQSTADRIRTLRDDYGYSDDTITGWVNGLSLEEAESKLEDKQDMAGIKRQQLRREIKEYCSLLDQEVPNIDTVPELEEKAQELHEELLEQIGATGEQLLSYFRGEAEIPEDIDRNNLIDALEKIRPLIRDRLKNEGEEE